MTIVNNTVTQLIKLLPENIVTDIKNGHRKLELVQSLSTCLNYNREMIKNTPLIKYFVINGINDTTEISEAIVSELFKTVRT